MGSRALIWQKFLSWQAIGAIDSGTKYGHSLVICFRLEEGSVFNSRLSSIDQEIPKAQIKLELDIKNPRQPEAQKLRLARTLLSSERDPSLVQLVARKLRKYTHIIICYIDNKWNPIPWTNKRLSLQSMTRAKPRVLWINNWKLVFTTILPN